MKLNERILSCLMFVLTVVIITSCTGAAPGSGGEKKLEAVGIHPTVAWVLACRVDGQGFGCFPGDSAFTTRTGMALEALEQLGALGHLQETNGTGGVDQVPSAAGWRFFRSCRILSWERNALGLGQRFGTHLLGRALS